MKKVTLLFVFLTGHLLFAQVGIGTENPSPSSQLDIHSNNRGLLIPQVALTGLTDATTIASGNVNSLLIYNTSTVGGLTPGYYYWLNQSWNRLMTESSVMQQLKATMPKFFYMPSIAIPTHRSHFVAGDGFSESGGVFSVNLYNRYTAQFNSIEVASPNRTTSLPLLPANELDYYITYYDKAVFETLTLSAAGVLT
ncbi:hypothetical protein [Gelidibacter maritimus]|uniref:Uncharacterized protein n=1 Tax=Gelidibacter maritimus TaxID=2761487 RepID=A0A7W2R3T6_9FLAO|nr:hypothetical protein [Gelidibacter maritimus]MBA6153192.1 hypothetical protein [Gelidibacter maritimus]